MRQQAEELKLLKNTASGIGIDASARVCCVASCSKVYVPRYVPLDQRCQFVRRLGGEGNPLLHAVCMNADVSCGCSTELCLKCHTPICEVHFAQHKRQCMLEKRGAGSRGAHADVPWNGSYRW